MIPKKGDIQELHIDRVAFGGQGIARVDGLVIFVKGAIPGDRVNALIFRKKKAYAEAKMQELLDPSPDRIEAPCPYFGICGGCQWQHVRYERQLEYKRGHVEEALSHIGSLSGIEVHAPIASEKRFAYRNKMEFSFSDRPWLPHPPSPISAPHPVPPPSEGGGNWGENGGGEVGVKQQHGECQTLALGLHVPGTFDKIIDVEACLLQQERGKRDSARGETLCREIRTPSLRAQEPRGLLAISDPSAFGLSR